MQVSFENILGCPPRSVATCRVAPFSLHRVSEVCHRGGDVLAFARAMHVRDPAAQSARVVKRVSLENEGAGNAGCALHPRSRAQRGSGLRARAYRAAEAIRHSLRNGFTAYNELSPVSRSSLATVASQIIPQDLTPAYRASGPLDFAVRSRAVRYRHYQRPPRPVPRSWRS